MNAANSFTGKNRRQGHLGGKEVVAIINELAQARPESLKSTSLIDSTSIDAPTPSPAPRFDPEELRRCFPALHQTVHGHPLIYLDNAATTHKPTPILQAMSEFYERNNANVHRALHDLGERATQAFEGARLRVARFINAPGASNIVFTRGTTEAINLVAQAWGRRHLQAGDQVLLTPVEHHSNLVPWQMICRSTGAELRFLPFDRESQCLRWECLNSLFTPRLKLVACTHVSNVLGAMHPVQELCRTARERGVVTLIDAAQSAGHAPLDVQELDCDFLAFSGHKLCGPTGIGVLYGRKQCLAAMDPWQGGGEMIETVSLRESTFAAPPQRFEAGTPAIAEAVGLHAALEFLDRVGRSTIARHESELASYGGDRLRELPGLRLLGPLGPRTGILSFTVDGIHAHDLVAFVNEQGIALRAGHLCAQPLLAEIGVSSVARASLYLYNTRSEIDRLLEVLRQAISFFR